MIVHNFSDSNNPTVLVKSEVVESEIPETKISESKSQEDEEITTVPTEKVLETKLKVNEIEVVDSNEEDDETCIQTELPEKKRNQLLNSWYDSCISTNTDEDVYKT